MADEAEAKHLREEIEYLNALIQTHKTSHSSYVTTAQRAATSDNYHWSRSQHTSTQTSHNTVTRGPGNQSWTSQKRAPYSSLQHKYHVSHTTKSTSGARFCESTSYRNKTAPYSNTHCKHHLSQSTKSKTQPVATSLPGSHSNQTFTTEQPVPHFDPSSKAGYIKHSCYSIIKAPPGVQTATTVTNSTVDSKTAAIKHEYTSLTSGAKPTVLTLQPLPDRISQNQVQSSTSKCIKGSHGKVVATASDLGQKTSSRATRGNQNNQKLVGKIQTSALQNYSLAIASDKFEHSSQSQLVQRDLMESKDNINCIDLSQQDSLWVTPQSTQPVANNSQKSEQLCRNHGKKVPNKCVGSNTKGGIKISLSHIHKNSSASQSKVDTMAMSDTKVDVTLMSDIHNKVDLTPALDTHSKVEVTPTLNTHCKVEVTPTSDTHNKVEVTPASDTHGKVEVTPTLDNHSKVEVIPTSDTHGKVEVTPTSDTHSKVEVTPTSDTHGEVEVTPTSVTHSEVEVTPTSDTHSKVEVTLTSDTCGKFEITPTLDTHNKVEVTPTLDTHNKVEVTPTSDTHNKVEVTPTSDTHGKVEVTPTLDTHSKVEVTPTLDTHSKVEVTPRTKCSCCQHNLVDICQSLQNERTRQDDSTQSCSGSSAKTWPDHVSETQLTSLVSEMTCSREPVCQKRSSSTSKTDRSDGLSDSTEPVCQKCSSLTSKTDRSWSDGLSEKHSSSTNNTDRSEGFSDSREPVCDQCFDVSRKANMSGGKVSDSDVTYPSNLSTSDVTHPNNVSCDDVTLPSIVSPTVHHDDCLYIPTPLSKSVKGTKVDDCILPSTSHLEHEPEKNCTFGSTSLHDPFKFIQPSNHSGSIAAFDYTIGNNQGQHTSVAIQSKYEFTQPDSVQTELSPVKYKFEKKPNVMPYSTPISPSKYRFIKASSAKFSPTQNKFRKPVDVPVSSKTDCSNYIVRNPYSVLNSTNMSLSKYKITQHSTEFSPSKYKYANSLVVSNSSETSPSKYKYRKPEDMPSSSAVSTSKYKYRKHEDMPSSSAVSSSKYKYRKPEDTPSSSAVSSSKYKYRKPEDMPSSSAVSPSKYKYRKPEDMPSSSAVSPSKYKFYKTVNLQDDHTKYKYKKSGRSSHTLINKYKYVKPAFSGLENKHSVYNKSPSELLVSKHKWVRKSSVATPSLHYASKVVSKYKIQKLARSSTLKQLTRYKSIKRSLLTKHLSYDGLHSTSHTASPSHGTSAESSWVKQYSLKRTNLESQEMSLDINMILGRNVKNLSKNKYKFIRGNKLAKTSGKGRRVKRYSMHKVSVLPASSKLRIDRRVRKSSRQQQSRRTKKDLKANRGRLVLIRGQNYSIGTRGKSLVKVFNHSGSMMQKKASTVSIRGLTYIQTKPGSLIKASYNQTRLLASRALQRSIQTAVASRAKKVRMKPTSKQYCIFYNRFGKCKRGAQCPYLHDPDKVAVCTRFLRGTCQVRDCPFSHQVAKEKLPVCRYFLNGKCGREDCPYPHVNVGKYAAVCQDFVNGYCPLGSQCKKKHTLVCPEYDRTGTCSKGDLCRLQHVNRATRRKNTQTGSARKRQRPDNREDHLEEQRSRGGPEDGDDISLPLGQRQLPAFIALNMSETGYDTSLLENSILEESVINIRPMLLEETE